MSCLRLHKTEVHEGKFDSVYYFWISYNIYLTLVSNIAACDVCEKTFKNVACLRHHKSNVHEGKFDSVYYFWILYYLYLTLI